MINQSKTGFLLKNLGRALIYALVIGVAYYLFKEYIIAENQEVWLKKFYSNPTLIYLIYIGSEVLFGLFPPEFFMLWAYHGGDVLHYTLNLIFFAGVSYGAGYLSFLIGRYLQRTVFFRFMSRKFFMKYWPLFRKFGSVLIIAAALTPLPWALISMLVGTTEYPLKRYLYFALFRILRFSIYGFIIFQTHQF
ncbi:SNARE-associated domain-containing protein [Mangrovibacterium diazotrophicum]|uniref:SNARE associated Golgi protein n=1 Tax=Mangrovibacterium diazotrophicum TaxID=1261403 RepID=A0A419W2M4_9BACT|nr:hypothetical protein [Mangrovibacterium diazotrophicum]RKD89735.1 hypothetical protein BC643_0067 [Mangrovibacterium diazotrophicum]